MLYEIVSNNPLRDNPGDARGQIYNIAVFIVDQVSESNNVSNEDDVKNECNLIAKDLLSFFQWFGADGYSDKNVSAFRNSGWSIEFIEERMSGLYAGVFLQFSLQSSFSYRRCIIPMDPLVANDTILASVSETDGLRSVAQIITADYELPVVSGATGAYILINRSGSQLTITTADSYTIEEEESALINDGESFWVYPDRDNNNWVLI